MKNIHLMGDDVDIWLNKLDFPVFPNMSHEISINLKVYRIECIRTVLTTSELTITEIYLI